jgi:hypothetical protein
MAPNQELPENLRSLVGRNRVGRCADGPGPPGVNRYLHGSVEGPEMGIPVLGSRVRRCRPDLRRAIGRLGPVPPVVQRPFGSAGWPEPVGTLLTERERPVPAACHVGVEDDRQQSLLHPKTPLGQWTLPGQAAARAAGSRRITIPGPSSGGPSAAGRRIRSGGHPVSGPGWGAGVTANFVAPTAGRQTG